ncbi:MAG: FtsQ-type POTRA domain-containing protein [Gemmatimonadetes bacterium]|nr:FtsQ-type POTRA domain-containing protein [Gemmatimonadota bacterium]
MDDPTQPPPDRDDAAPRPRARWRRVAWAGLGLVLLASPFWGRAVLRQMRFFNVRTVRVEGVRYVDPAVLVARLRVDTTVSLFADGDAWIARVNGHPQVDSVRIARELPGTLVLQVSERLPVALVPAAGGLVALDATGRRLPVDPARLPMDLPVVANRDVRLLAMLDTVRRTDPALFSAISDVRRERGELRLRVTGVEVRAPLALGAARLADIVPVTDDLARRRVRVAELDLRYRDQVIARMPQ